ncbi:hypothetical protein [Asticcacaulis sp. AND118]|uniref:hypothetical protein n=1 Tax=Asticcacaulis sp. AND118 TaxID=2840468 RepID=UPI001CFFB6F6|nr:hypothetical protein [Asticcacaulis sp. AND118]UDF03053.1 hypothetical protein LH365_11515 [Asticcacaulis sp. AND118]
MITPVSSSFHYSLPYLTVCAGATIVVTFGIVAKIMRLHRATRSGDFFARYERLAVGLALLTEILALAAILTGSALLLAAIGLAGYVVVIAAYSLNDAGDGYASLFSIETLRVDMALVGLLVVLLTIAYSLRLAH